MNAYVEDYNSEISEVVPLSRRGAHGKRQSSGLANCMTYDEGISDSGYSSHSVNQQQQSAEQPPAAEQKSAQEHLHESRDGKEQRGMRESHDSQEPRDRVFNNHREYREYQQSKEREGRDSGRDEKDIKDGRHGPDVLERDSRDPRESREPREYREMRDARDPRDFREPRHTREMRGDPREAPMLHSRRMSSQLAAVMATANNPTPLNSRPASKNLVRTGSPALRRPESPDSSGDDSDCDCAKCKGTDKKSPTSPLSSSWNLNYPPFNNTMRTASVPPPPQMLAHSFPSSYPDMPPSQHPPYGGSRHDGYRLPPPPATGLEEEALDDGEPPRRPDSSRRERMARPMSYAAPSNPVSSHSAWATAFNGSYYPPPPSGPPGSNLSSPPPSYQTYPPPPVPIPGTSASSSPQTQPLVPFGMPPPPTSSSSMGFGYPYPYGPPPSSNHGDIVPMYPPPSGVPPPPSLSGSAPKDYAMPPPPPPVPINRRYSMRSSSGDLPPARDFSMEGSPGMAPPHMAMMHSSMGPPPLPTMNRRASQRGGQPPHFHPSFHGEVPRSVSVPPAMLHEMNASMGQDGRRRVNTPQPLLSASRIRRDSNASSAAASSRLPPSQLTRFGELDTAAVNDIDGGPRSYDRYSHPVHPPHSGPHHSMQTHHQRLLSSERIPHDNYYNPPPMRHLGAGTASRQAPRHDDDFEPEIPTDYHAANGHARMQLGGGGGGSYQRISQAPRDHDYSSRYIVPPDRERQLALPYASEKDDNDTGALAEMGRFRSDSVIGDKREYILGEEPL